MEWEVVVTLDKEKFPVRATWEEDGFTVDIEGGETVVLNTDWTVVLNTDWTVGEPMMLADIGGKKSLCRWVEGLRRYNIILSMISSHEHTSINPKHNT